MRAVTDPELLRQLNEPERPTLSNSGFRPVTDPALLEQLNAPEAPANATATSEPMQSSTPPQSQGRTALDYGLRGLTFGFGNKAANALGALGASIATGENPIDLYNEAAQMQQNRMGEQLKQYPKTAIGSELAGGLLTGVASTGTKAGTAVADSLGSGNILARIGKGALAGAASGGLYGAGTAEPDQSLLQGAKQGATSGAAFGAALPVAAKVLGAAKNAIVPDISENVRDLAKKAFDYGIPLSRTQIGDSNTAKTIASATNKIPLTGAAGFQKAQQSAFNREVLDTIGVKADKVTPELISEAYGNISKQFDSALKGQNIKIGDDVLNALSEVESNAYNDLIPDNFGIVKKQINKILSSVSEDGTIPGEKIGNLRSDLSGLTKGQGNEKRFIRQLKDIVQEASVAGAPERKEALQDAIQKFRNYQIVKPLLNKAVRGDIPASQLLSKVASNYSDFAQGGGGKLGDLAKIGQAFLKDPIPDSGTAQRMMVYKALETLGMGGAGAAAAGAPGALAAIGGPIALGRAFNTVNTFQPLARMAANKGPSALLSLPPAIFAPQAALLNQ